MTILIAVGCSQKQGIAPPPDSKVKISCKADIISGELQFTMWDSNDDKKVVAEISEDDPTKLVADLITDVEPGITVDWKWVKDSDVKRFVKIGPTTPGNIIPGNAHRVFLSRKLRLEIPDGATEGEESYYIEFEVDGKSYKVDPYLKIR